MSVYSLTPQNFQLQGDTLMTTVQGYSLVMYVTQNCKFCQQFMPQFRTLPNKTPGVSYHVCSVDGTGLQIHKWSLQSSSPIKAAPTFIFYNNGIPFAEYKGPRTVQNIVAFIQGAVGECQQRGAMQAQTQLGHSGSQLRTRQNDPSQRQMPQIDPRSQGGAGGVQAPAGMPAMPQSMSSSQGPPQQQQKWIISPTTGVKEFETSYGRPYNTTNDQEFLEYERAYLESKS
jgi:hypothetical protein